MPLTPEIDALTRKIIGCAITVHSTLGPGLLESAYQTCLVLELRHGGLRVDVDVAVPVVYRGVRINCGYRLDLLVEGIVILELKTVSVILPVHEAQLLTYLKLTEKPVGLLLNFNVKLLKDGGICRKINA
jgi:GxxExxY protein